MQEVTHRRPPSLQETGGPTGLSRRGQAEIAYPPKRKSYNQARQIGGSDAMAISSSRKALVFQCFKCGKQFDHNLEHFGRILGHYPDVAARGGGPDRESSLRGDNMV